MITKRRTYLVQDPCDEDTFQLIRAIFTHFGLRPVCFYTDRWTRFHAERQYRLLTSDRVEAAYDVDVANPGAFAEAIRERFQVLGVVACREETIEFGATLCGLLGLDWNAPETLRRFRDKHALKQHVRAVDPSVRVPECRLVRSFDEVWTADLPPRFVLKPNDGVGNRAVGIFEAHDREAIRKHLEGSPGTLWILEEYIAGPEFHVDGQVRANREVVCLGLFEYQRVAVNGYPTVYRSERQCRTNHPLFGVIADYAHRLLQATGLRRCPFHLELKVDERGPCLIDLGARFASEGGGLTLSRLHPGRPDAYTVAAYDYLSDNSFAMDAVDWAFYDKELTVLVYGISHDSGLIAHLAGVEEIEAMPEFITWAVKPQLGDRLSVTRDLRSAPYIVELSHRGDDREAERLIDFVHHTVRWNDRVTATEWLRARTALVSRRAPARLSWLGHRAFRRPAAPGARRAAPRATRKPT